MLVPAGTRGTPPMGYPRRFFSVPAIHSLLSVRHKDKEDEAQRVCKVLVSPTPFLLTVGTCFLSAPLYFGKNSGMLSHLSRFNSLVVG